jgi:hypothetical protein
MHTLKPLRPDQVSMLRSVAGAERRLARPQANVLHRRNLIRVVDQCPSGCCRVYTATAFGERALADYDAGGRS